MRKTALTMFGGLLRLVGLRGQWRRGQRKRLFIVRSAPITRAVAARDSGSEAQ
jgi:hypothetical protein